MFFKSAGTADHQLAVVINWLGLLSEFSGYVIYGLSLTQNTTLKTNTKHGFIFL